MIRALVRHQKEAVVMRHAGAVDMRAEIPLHHAPETLVVHFIRDLTDRTVRTDLQHGELAVVVTGHKEIPVGIVRRQIAAAHAVDRCVIDHLQRAVLLNGIGLDAHIRNGIEVFAVVRDGQIRGVGDLHLILLNKPAVLHVHIIDLDPVIVSLRVGGNIGYILCIRHREPPNFHNQIYISTS